MKHTSFLRLAVLTALCAVLLVSCSVQKTSDTAIPGVSEEADTQIIDGISAEADLSQAPEEAENDAESTVLVPYITENTVNLAADTNIASPYVVFMDAASGEILAEKYVVPGSAAQPSEVLPDVINTRIYPASLTKLMAILVAYENCDNPDEVTLCMTDEILEPLKARGLAMAGFQSGETITMRDMLYGAALPSGGEACVGLAYVTSGNEADFVELMNERAASLGMNNTHFCNCTGIQDENHYSTLTDIAVLLAYMEQNKDLAGILGTYEYTSSATDVHPDGVRLMSTVFTRLKGDEPGVCTIIGGKTGSTPAAMQCLALFGVRNEDGHPFVSVIAGGETKWDPVHDSIYLYGNFTGNGDS